ncbi:MAG: S1 RNA-binding domain-containing protein, partial [Clostridiaceae bacterium]|nr:S1 RNA-binding domain-containing protein [Clostridiaceae bacterium]
MPQGDYMPEGMLIDGEKNKSYTLGHTGMMKAMADGAILEATAAMCDSKHNLIIDFGDIKGIIPRDEAAVGIESGRVRDIAIISKVGKPVCFKVIGREDDCYILSRKRAQQEALDWFMEHVENGEIIRSTVTHLEPFGAFVDMGCGNISLIGIENISVSRIAHPADRFYTGQNIYAAVLSKNNSISRAVLTHRELLGTWQQNSDRFMCGQTTIGTVRGIEDYGIFVELTPNLSGLAEAREGVKVGDSVSVFIKSIIPDRMKVKLIIIDTLAKRGPSFISDSDYFMKSGKLDSWVYSPCCCRG